ncbi:MAG: PorT family protein [Dysgonamonadaceae bacterium]|jgi:hypothetical protein|nr:PorT family protein [Dysgonamonadaceae bacterium]
MRNFVFVTAILLATGTSVFAQGLQFGVKAGGNLSSVIVSKDVDGLKSKPGFQVGVTVDYGLSGNLYLLSGLEVVQKGFKIEQKYEGEKYTSTSSPLYLQLPIYVGYKIDLGVVKFVPQVGPYIAYGLGGKVKQEGFGETEEYDFFGKDSNFKRLDFGLGMGVGVEFGKIGVTVGYNLGLVNIVDEQEDSDDSSAKNGSLFLSVGYKF